MTDAGPMVSHAGTVTVCYALKETHFDENEDGWNGAVERSDLRRLRRKRDDDQRAGYERQAGDAAGGPDGSDDADERVGPGRRDGYDRLDPGGLSQGRPGLRGRGNHLRVDGRRDGRCGADDRRRA